MFKTFNMLKNKNNRVLENDQLVNQTMNHHSIFYHSFDYRKQRQHSNQIIQDFNNQSINLIDYRKGTVFFSFS